MGKEKKEWFNEWFNEDYLDLYSYHDQAEADQQINFLMKALKLKGNESILDLCCGTGRHSIALGKKGFHVVGVDNSQIFIEIALKKIQNLTSFPVSFLVRDMRDLKNLGLFDLVLSIFTSFGYFNNEIENEKVIKEIRQITKLKGLYFLDYLHPYFIEKTLKPFQEKIINNEKVTIKTEIIDDTVIKTIIFPKKTYYEKVKLYNREVLEKMLLKHQFCIKNIWNDYQGNPWKPDGERQLFLCQAI